jgi:WD40 repeat protein
MSAPSASRISGIGRSAPETAHAQYDAFISYSHRDGDVAAAIQRGLHRLAKPVWRLRALRIFLDRTDLAASPQLWPRIRESLDESRFLICVLSESAAQSEYVERELEHWLSRERADRVLLVLAGGELAWDGQRRAYDPNRSSAAPPALLQPGVFHDEPLYVELTWADSERVLDLAEPRFRSAIGDLAAPIHGRSKADLDSDDVREHARLRRLRRIAVSMLAILLVLAVVAAAVAVGQARRATREADAARRQAAVAQAQLAAVRSATAGTPWAAVAFAVEAELRTPEPLPEARSAMAKALQRLGRLPVKPRGILNRPQHPLTADIESVDLSPDGRRFVTGRPDGRLEIWDADSLRQDGPTVDWHGAVDAVAWSPKGGQLAVRGSDTSGLHEVVQFLDVQGRVQRSVRGKVRLVNAFAWSPDGAWLALGTDDGLRLADPRTGVQLALGTMASLGSVDSIAWSPDGQQLVTAGDDGVLQLDASSGVQIAQPLAGSDARVVDVAWSPDGRRLATASARGAVQVLSWSNRQWLHSPARVRSGSARSVAWSPDSALVASTDSGGALQLWDGVTGGAVGDSVPTDAGELLAVKWSSDGGRLLACGLDGTVRVWDRLTGAHAMRSEKRESVRAVTWSPTGDRVATAMQDGVARLWDARTGAPVGRIGRVGGSKMTAVEWSPKGDLIATAAEGAAVTVWDVHNGAQVAVMRNSEAADALAWSPDGERIAAAVPGGQVMIWDARAGSPVTQMLGGPIDAAFAVYAIAWAPDGTRIATATEVGLRIWSVKTRRPIGQLLKGHQGQVRDVAWSPDSTRLASSGLDGTLRRWDAASGAPIGQPSEILTEYGAPGTGDVRSLAWSPNGLEIATGDSDGTLRLWSAATGGAIGEPMATGSVYIYSVSWSPDGRRLAVGGIGGGARVWEAMDEGTACGRALAALGAEGLQALVGEGQPALPCATPNKVRTLAPLPVIPGMKLFPLA